MASKGNGITFISAQTSIEGDIQLGSTALVAGKLQGKIGSAGQIKIEHGGEIAGEVSCDELRVCGVFSGRVCCNKLTITSSGVVEGEVASHQMEIYEGGQFIGQRIKGPELDALADMLQAPSIQRSDTHLYASESGSLRGEHRAIRPWLYVAAATVVMVLGFSFGPEQLREWLPNVGDSTLKTEEFPVTQGMDAANGVNPLLTEQTIAPDTVANNTTALATAVPESLAMSQDAAMEDLQQMEQGHAQMAQGDNGAAPISENAGNKL